ncbi:MAG: PilZ domain-containing protein [bacterium]
MSESESELRRRQYPRVRESCELSYRVVMDPALKPEEEGAVAVNISGGGMRFRADQELEPGTMVALRMTLPELPTPVVSLARVVWCEQTPAEAAQYDVGVEFWWIGWSDGDVQSEMLRYVNEKLQDMGIDPTGEPG